MGWLRFLRMVIYAVSLVAVIALIVQSVKNNARQCYKMYCVSNSTKNVYNKQVRGHTMNQDVKSRFKLVIFVVLSIAIASGLMLYALRPKYRLVFIRHLK